MNQHFLMTPGYITGLTHTDGSFFCKVILSAKHRFGLQFRPKFTITADLNSKHVLEQILSYFKCGNITINIKNFTAEYQVNKLNELNTIILPPFEEYPVYCNKLHAFILFKKIVQSLINKDKNSIEGRRELLKIALSMNQTTNRKIDRINLLFSLLGVENEIEKELIPTTIYPVNNIFDNIISGIIDGDGSFYVSFQKDGIIKTGFNITSDLSSRPLLELIKQKLNNIGSIKIGNKNEIVLTVSGFNQINETLIPFMDKNHLLSERAQHYLKFRKVNQYLNQEGGATKLSLETKLKIVELAYNMNKEGKHRNLSKEEYIKLLSH